MESTILYSAWIKNEIIIGSAMEIRSFPTGMVAILLSSVFMRNCLRQFFDIAMVPVRCTSRMP